MGEAAFAIALQALRKGDLAERSAVLLTNLLTDDKARETLR